AAVPEATASGDTKYGINSSVDCLAHESTTAAEPARPSVFRNRRRSITPRSASVVARQAIVRRVRIAMTADAPSHRQRSDACDAIHGGDVAVARLAGDVRQHVRLVIEPDEARQRVHLDPM